MILLFNPRSCNWKYRLPNSLLSLGSVLEGKYEYEIVDGNLLCDPLPVLSTIIGEKRVDMLGVTVMPGPQLQQAIPLCKSLKEKFPHLTIIWGGYFPSNHTDVCARSPFVDYVLRGQGEGAFPQLVEAVVGNGKILRSGIPYSEISAVPNISFKSDSSVVHHNAMPLIHPDDLPPLPYHKVDVEKYVGKTYLGTRTLSYHSSYGCPFECSFCAIVPIYKARWLGRNAAAMADDIEKLVLTYGANAIEFHDNNFFTSERRVVEFSEEILRRDLRFTWWGEGRPDTLLKFSDETFSLMKRAGLKMVFMGAESGDDERLSAMNKGGTQTGGTILEVVEKFRRHGIVPECSFVFGTPPVVPNAFGTQGGAPAQNVSGTIEKDIRFVRRLKKINPAAEIIMYMYSPIPLDGSTLYQRVTQSGFTYPQTLEEWLKPEWASFDLRKNPLTPWLSPRHIRRVRSFEKVLNAVFPTNSDIKLKRFQR
ncbi:MAG: B12-binding domain-containing radical SAM protein, partial [Bacteroidota bacterium]|nr:B12-binding domain-containing radical SAM protein [Bacteroidota bacterium]